MKCHECNREMTESMGDYHYLESGLDNVFLKNVCLHTCECGESFASIRGVVHLNAFIGRTLLKKKGRLVAQEIRFLRKNIGLSAKMFIEYIGVNKSTFSRWENDKQNIDKSNDRIIRLIYATLKGLPNDEVMLLLDDVFKEINKKGRKWQINIPPELLGQQGCGGSKECAA